VYIINFHCIICLPLFHFDFFLFLCHKVKLWLYRTVLNRIGIWLCFESFAERLMSFWYIGHEVLLRVFDGMEMMFISVVFRTIALRLSHDCVIVFSDGMYCLHILFLKMFGQTLWC